MPAQKRPAQKMPAQKRPAQNMAPSPAQKMARSTVQYEFWPSSLRRTGHTTVDVDPADALYKRLQEIPKHPVYEVHMARMEQLPCQLQPTSKFRNGADRWWCPVHQGNYGKKAQIKAAEAGGEKCCDHADVGVDFVRTSEVFEFCLVPRDAVMGPNDYCELGVWIGLAPSIDTVTAQTKFFPCIRVCARKTIGGPKVVDKSFPAVRIKDKTGRFPRIPSEGITVTTPAALEFLYYLENLCPVNARLGLQVVPGQSLPRSAVDLTDIVRCKHCEALHEDIGDFFGQKLHRQHLCFGCGRNIYGPPSIGNPMKAFAREWKREVAGMNIDPHNAEVHLNSANQRFMVWPSTPALFWSWDAPEIWGIHVHACDEKGERVIDGTFGLVHLDGKVLDRAQLFADMLKNSNWMEDHAELKKIARELEDD
eukprot:gb/GFBE01004396.1/.p1 GENE.gb/GFBE01004396.1/~~gb/GFBE01004396.1/.p1  ORF type:complete len:422 (+),score=96.64 gb/GFBE01004396.1/:1-1266(+)